MAKESRYFKNAVNNGMLESGRTIGFHPDGSVLKGKSRGDDRDGIGYLHLPEWNHSKGEVRERCSAVRQ
jgi:hypothetical protein